MHSCMLPYLRIVIESTSSLVNKEKWQQLGVHMIETASTKLEKMVNCFVCLSSVFKKLTLMLKYHLWPMLYQSCIVS